MTGAGTTPTDTATKIRAFLDGGNDFPDTFPMWSMGGVTLTWGDLRAISDYNQGQQRLPEETP